jgi:hypothetical protein
VPHRGRALSALTASSIGSSVTSPSARSSISAPGGAVSEVNDG